MKIGAVGNCVSFGSRKPYSERTLTIPVEEPAGQGSSTEMSWQKYYDKRQKGLGDFDGFCFEAKDPYAEAFYRLSCQGSDCLGDAIDDEVEDFD